MISEIRKNRFSGAGQVLDIPDKQSSTVYCIQTQTSKIIISILYYDSYNKKNEREVLSWVSSIGVVTSYGLDDKVSILGRGKRFFS
jgi:hypothetical protein